MALSWFLLSFSPCPFIWFHHLFCNLTCAYIREPCEVRSSPAIDKWHQDAALLRRGDFVQSLE